MVVLRTEMYMTTIHSKRNGSHLYRNVNSENPYTRNRIVIRTIMYMTKTHSKVMDSHLYRNVHDENPYTRISIVIRTNMYMTKTHTKTYVNMDIQSTILYMTKHRPSRTLGLRSVDVTQHSTVDHTWA